MDKIGALLPRFRQVPITAVVWSVRRIRFGSNRTPETGPSAEVPRSPRSQMVNWP